MSYLKLFLQNFVFHLTQKFHLIEKKGNFIKSSCKTTFYAGWQCKKKFFLFLQITNGYDMSYTFGIPAREGVSRLLPGLKETRRITTHTARFETFIFPLPAF